MFFVAYFSLPTSWLIRNPEVRAKLTGGVEWGVREWDDIWIYSSPSKPCFFIKQMKTNLFIEHQKASSRTTLLSHVSRYFFSGVCPDFNPKELLLELVCPALVFACWGRGMAFVPHLQMAWMLLLYWDKHFPMGCIQKVLFVALIQNQVTKNINLIHSKIQICVINKHYYL